MLSTITNGLFHVHYPDSEILLVMLMKFTHIHYYNITEELWFSTQPSFSIDENAFYNPQWSILIVEL